MDFGRLSQKFYNIPGDARQINLVAQKKNLEEAVVGVHKSWNMLQKKIYHNIFFRLL